MSCGALEGVYLLDPFFTAAAGEEEVPEAVHTDTHGQSATIFGLAYLLGIELMPRIRGWKDLTWCRPGAESHYTHIEGLFTDTVDWEVITTHHPDMLRVALSIGAGLSTENDWLEQRKAIKYTHLVANCVMFYTVARLSRELAQLHAEGYPLNPEAVAALSPYRTPHLHRLGRYTLDLTRVPQPLEYDLPLFMTGNF